MLSLNLAVIVLWLEFITATVATTQVQHKHELKKNQTDVFFVYQEEWNSRSFGAPQMDKRC